MRGVIFGLFEVLGLGPPGFSLAGLGFRPNLGLGSCFPFALVSLGLLLAGMRGGRGPKRLLLGLFGFSLAGLGFLCPNRGLVSFLGPSLGLGGYSVARGAIGTRGGRVLSGAALGSVHAGTAARTTPSPPFVSLLAASTFPFVPLVPLALTPSSPTSLLSFRSPPSPDTTAPPRIGVAASPCSSPSPINSSSMPRSLCDMSGEGTGESGTGCA